MKKTILAVIAVAATFASTGALGNTTFGGTDCGKWIQEPTVARKSWVLGFLSGMNAIHYFNTNRDVLDAITSAEQIFLWMDNYCKANPLKKVSEGGLDLFIEIGGKGNKK